MRGFVDESRYGPVWFLPQSGVEGPMLSGAGAVMSVYFSTVALPQMDSDVADAHSRSFFVADIRLTLKSSVGTPEETHTHTHRDTWDR